LKIVYGTDAVAGAAMRPGSQRSLRLGICDEGWGGVVYKNSGAVRP